MVRLRVTELLEERNLTKYWLWKRLGMSYDNYNKMIKNETHSIRYDVIDSLMKIPTFLIRLPIKAVSIMP